GFTSSSNPKVSLVWLVPSAFIAQISELLPERRTKAIFAPSGDQVGSLADPLSGSKSATTVSPVPSELETCTRGEKRNGWSAHAIRVPSGEYAGCIAGGAIRRRSPLPSGLIARTPAGAS